MMSALIASFIVSVLTEAGEADDFSARSFLINSSFFCKRVAAWMLASSKLLCGRFLWAFALSWFLESSSLLFDALLFSTSSFLVSRLSLGGYLLTRSSMMKSYTSLLLMSLYTCSQLISTWMAGSCWLNSPFVSFCIKVHKNWSKFACFRSFFNFSSKSCVRSCFI